jgi:Family of unknown function (DUF5906)
MAADVKIKTKKKLTLEYFLNETKKRILREKLIGFALLPRGAKKAVMIGKNNLCETIDKEQFMQLARNITVNMFDYFSGDWKNPEMCLMTETTASALYRTAKIMKEFELKDIKPFAFKSDDSLTYARAPFDPFDTVVASPRWDNFLSNFTNEKALRMWVGSLFVPDSDRSQYLWLYGQGGNGKSTLARILGKVLGPFVRFDQTPNKDDKHWTNGLIGKRLVVFDDCNHYGFVKTGLFKSLTGATPVRCEPKFCEPFDTDLDCKFLFTSNEMPMVSTEIADQRRLIFCSARNKTSFDFNPAFEDGLKDELGAFVSNCILLYREHCQDGRPIPSDQTEALEMGGCFDEEIEAWIEGKFTYDPTSHVTVADFRDQLSFTKLDARRVYKFLDSKGVHRSSVKIGDVIKKSIKGLRLVKQDINFRNF